MAVTGRDGWAESEMPFGVVVASIGRSLLQSTWVGADQAVEIVFNIRRDQVEKVGHGL